MYMNGSSVSVQCVVHDQSTSTFLILGFQHPMSPWGLIDGKLWNTARWGGGGGGRGVLKSNDENH